MKILREWKGKSGVYKITNIINNKIYIGSSNELYNRLSTYKCLFKKGKVHNKHLQSSFNKYGFDNFKLDILEFCDLDLKVREQSWIDNLQPEYNKRTNVDFNYQVSHTQETRNKISTSLKKAFINGEKTVNRVQIHSLQVSLFNLNAELIKRFDSIGLLKEFIGCSNRHISRTVRTESFKFKNYLICLTTDEYKIKPYAEYKIERYAKRKKRVYKRNTTGGGNVSIS